MVERVIGAAMYEVLITNPYFILPAILRRALAELNVEIHGSAVGATMARLFREDCGESVPFTLGDWRHRPRGRRFASRLAATLSAWQ